MGADFRTQGAKRTSEHKSMYFFKFHLLLINELAVVPKTLKRRHRSGKPGVQGGAIFLPFPVKALGSKASLGIEEIIKAALLDPGFLADLIDGGAVVGTRPKQFPDRFHQSFFGITDAAHIGFFLHFAPDSSSKHVRKIPIFT